ncbi:VOC family protein [Kribbella sp. NPDC049227]|uniref:VOC family protein n=1 Tax=Kribbella sp. NPDC049227 TaxID=3364113 RepID=UPI003717F428
MTQERVTATEFQQADGVGDWRVVDGAASAWYDAPSLSVGAALAARIAGLTGGDGLPDVDLRASGVRVRIGGPSADLTGADVELASVVSAAARELGLAADPAALQVMRLVIDAANTPSVKDFWQTMLAYEPAGADSLRDPLRRDPAVSIRGLDEPRPLRNRIHVDVGRDPAAVDAVKAALGQEPFGAYELTLADNEGNEADLVAGGELSTETTDWLANFGAMTFYPTTSTEQAVALATAVAQLADDGGVPVLVDVRPDGVTIDSGKDQWEDDEDAPLPAFVDLAAGVQKAAGELGLSADPTRLRFVQLGFDAVDVPAVRAFWTALLGYQHDPRLFLTDIYDPRRLNPVLFFQQLDPADEPRHHQRNRLHLELAVPQDQVQHRVTAALSTGGRLISRTPNHHRLADPDGNEVAVIADL